MTRQGKKISTGTVNNKGLVEPVVLFFPEVLRNCFINGSYRQSRETMEYQPIQLNSNINYTEIQPSNWLNHKIVCYWEIKTREVETNYPVIPDGCVDLVVNCTSRNQAFISPSLISPGIFTLGKNETWFGVRFYPAVLSPALKIGLSELQFETVELEDISVKLNRQISEALNGTTSINERANKLNYLLPKIGLANEQNNGNGIYEVINSIYQSKGRIVLKDYKDKTFSVSERHLRRLFNQEVGLSPKRFSRIVRSHFFLNELKQNPKSKSYYDTYFDQAHLIRELKSITGFTPKQLVLNLV